MKIKVIMAVILSSLVSSIQASSLLSYWNFNNDSSTLSGSNFGSLSTTAGAFGERYDSTTYKLYSNTSNSTIFNDSSIYVDLSSLIGKGTYDNGGTTNDACWGLYTDTTTNRASTDSTTGGSLLIKGSNYNNSTLVFNLSSLGYQSLSVSYAERTNNSASIAQNWSYSTDGATWTSCASYGNTNLTFVQCTFNLPTELDNLSVFYLKLTLVMPASASSALDNFQLTGVAIPEPSTYALCMVGVVLLLSVGKVRKLVRA